MNRSETLLLGMVIGAGLTYLLDPDRGTRRRALVRDKLVHAGHGLEDTVTSTARHARNRARGLAHEAKSALREGNVDDRVLEERVRSRVGRGLSNGADLNVTAEYGRVTLSGAVAPDEVQDVVRSAKSVRGVDEVDNQLDVQVRSDDGA